MKVIIIIITAALIFVSCGNNEEIKKLKENQSKLEARITKLEQDMKEQIKIDSILLEFQKPQPGSLLYELEQKKNK